MSVKDPICGMELDPKEAAGTSEYRGQMYYFCSEHCKKAFDKKYVTPDHRDHPHSEHP